MRLAVDGIVNMTPERYFECWREAEEWAGPAVFEGIPIELVLAKKKWAAVSTAVYIATDKSGEVCYVGSVKRESLAGLAGRMRGHEGTVRFQQWQRLYIVPLLDGSPLEVVRSIEGRVGRLLRPTGNIRLPKG